MAKMALRSSLFLALFASGFAQTPATPTFDVASVKPNKSADMGMRVMFQPGGRFTATNLSLKFLITLAYDVRDFQVANGPSWIDSDRYDVEAKGEASSLDMRSMTEEQRKADFDHRRQMLQALLADRFKLALHKESKETSIYALVVAKSGLKIKELPPAPPPDPQDMPDKPDPKRPIGRGSMRMGPGELTGHGVKLAFLTDALSNMVGRKVVDQTGLNGDYDLELKWTPDENHGPGDASPSSDANGPSIFTAIQEQLGLKLESQKGPVDLIVIDHVEKATAN